MVMRRFFSIFIALLTLLPPPALLAGGGAPACATEAGCAVDCLCCAQGLCHCAENEEFPPQEPAVPVRGEDLNSVTALPPAKTGWRRVSPAVENASACEVDEAETMHGRRVALFVRHCAWLR